MIANNFPLLWVAGGRTYNHRTRMTAVLHPYLKANWILITGSQRGADHLAERICRDAEHPYIGIPARWSSLGNPAGPHRNRLIAEIFRPDLLLAFPGGPGTAGAKKEADEFGIPVIDVWDPGY